MKKALVLLALVSSAAQAQMIDNSCFATLRLPSGKVKKASLPRKSLSYLGKDLIVGFTAAYYDGQPDDLAVVIIEDKHSHKREVFSDYIQYRWNWVIEHDTVYGHVKIQCQ